MLIEGKTKTGFEFKIDERIGKDWRVISNIALAESADPMEQVRGTTELVNFILGDNRKAFMEHIAKNNEGFIPVTAITAELVDIISSSKTTKNS